MRIHKYLLPLVAMVLASCSRFDVVDRVFENSAYLNVSATDQTQLATFNNRINETSVSLAVQLAYPADKDISATVSVDASLVDEYNHRHSTAYEMLPSQYFDFPGKTVSVTAGRVSSEKVEIRFKGLAGEGENNEGAMELDKTWILPVKVSSGDIGIMSSAGVAYYHVKRTSAISTAAQLTDNWIKFPKMNEIGGSVAAAYNGLTAVTYEAFIYIDKFDTTNDFGDCSISTVMGVEQYLLLRIGDTNFERRQLQFDGSGNGSQFGKLPSKGDPSKNLSAGQWYHVACTYDQATRTARIYLNGELTDESKDVGVTGSSEENRINLAMRGMEGATNSEYEFFIGKSYNDYRPLQGKIAEARVWKCARTQEEIMMNMQRIENPEQEPDLIGYWKFDEGEGNNIKDYSSVGNDGVAEKDIVWPQGIEIPDFNK